MQKNPITFEQNKRVTVFHEKRFQLPMPSMMTSSNRNIFRVTGHLCGEVPGEFPAQRPVTRSFDVFFDLCLINDWVNNREAGDLRRHVDHYDVSVMQCWKKHYKSEYVVMYLQMNPVLHRLNIYKFFLILCTHHFSLDRSSQVKYFINSPTRYLPSYPGYFREPHWLSMGLPEISRVTWQVCDKQWVDKQTKTEVQTERLRLQNPHSVI